MYPRRLDGKQDHWTTSPTDNFYPTGKKASVPKPRIYHIPSCTQKQIQGKVLTVPLLPIRNQRWKTGNSIQRHLWSQPSRRKTNNSLPFFQNTFQHELIQTHWSGVSAMNCEDSPSYQEGIIWPLRGPVYVFPTFLDESREYLDGQDNISASGISCEWLYNPCTAETIGENGIHIRMWHSFGNDLQLQPCIAWVRRVPSVKVPGVGSDRWRLEHLQVLSTVCQMSPVTIWALSEVSLLVALRTKLAHIIPMLTVKSVFFVQVGPPNQTMLLVSQ